MDILFETAIGDAQVSARGGRHRQGVQRQIDMAAALPADGTPDAAAVDAFIGHLRGIKAADLDRLRGSILATPLPAGYRHFRLFDARTGRQWHSAFVYEEGRVLTLHDVLSRALNHPTTELTTWTATEWLSDMIAGVLDLELTFAAEPRTRRPFRLRP